MTKWLLGDPHFGHKNILRFEPKRPFNSTEEMDEHILHEYDCTVNDGDTIYWLGDMFFCNTPRMEYISQRLSRTRNILIRGNHDKGISDNKFMRLGFLPKKMDIVDGVVLTHEPMIPTNDKWLGLYEPNFVGNIHAHTHSKDIKLDPTRWHCVSVEMTDFKPVKLDNVISKMKNANAMEWYKETKGMMPYFETGDHLR